MGISFSVLGYSRTSHWPDDFTFCLQQIHQIMVVELGQIPGFEFDR